MPTLTGARLCLQSDLTNLHSRSTPFPSSTYTWRDPPPLIVIFIHIMLLMHHLSNSVTHAAADITLHATCRHPARSCARPCGVRRAERMRGCAIFL